MNEVRVNRKAAGRVASGHPWIFSSDIADRDGAQPGEAVKVADPRGRTLGTAHYSSTSQIALRMLSPEVEEIGRDFYLAPSARRRGAPPHAWCATPTPIAWCMARPICCPRWWSIATAITWSCRRSIRAWTPPRARLSSCLEEIFQPRGIVARNDVAVRTKEQLPLETAVLAGEVPESVAIHMNGFNLRADLLGGQKTGIFLDQRENYVAAARYAHGKALDCFTSTGGFALHLAGKCESVEAVDSSGPALATARLNAEANGIANIHFQEADVFELLAGYAAARRQYSFVVLDPPAFAKSRHNLEAAVTGYREINLRALRLLGPGGILVTCSCSHHLGEAMFLELIAQASLDAGRTVRVLERRTQAQDHPILLTVPETHYLKCLILEVV